MGSEQRVHPTVQRLTAILSPPDSPGTAPPWQTAPGTVGIAFPCDFRDFVDRYGGGEVNGALSVPSPTLAPHGPGRSGGFLGYVQRTTSEVGPVFAELRDKHPGDNPYPLLPEPGGLLLWGSDSNGNHCFWLTTDPDPDRWPVVVWLRQVLPPQWRLFEGGMADLLLAVVDGSWEYAGAFVGDPLPTPRWSRLEDWGRDYDGP